MLYKEELNRIIGELKARRRQLEREMSTLPDGYLHIQKRGEREFYSLRLPKEGNRKKERRRGITNDGTELYGLIRKRYITNALRIIEQDIETLQKASERYREFDESTVMKGFVDAHPWLKNSIMHDDSAYDEWAANYEREEDLFESGLTSLATDGTLMRSRGEIIIAEKLRQYGIPFRYEMKLYPPEIPYVPDFTIKRPRDGKIFYWEHFGDVNDSEYMKRNRRKLEVYEEHGIVPWDNLIITYDTKDGGVNTPLIDAMMHAWLL